MRLNRSFDLSEQSDEIMGCEICGKLPAASVCQPLLVGGEEFLILAPDTGRAGALEIAEKVRIALHGVRVSGVEQPVTASFGVATLLEPHSRPTPCCGSPTARSTAPSEHGRDRVEAPDPPVAT